MVFTREATTQVATVEVCDEDLMPTGTIGTGEIDIAKLCGNQACTKVATVSLKTKDGSQVVGTCQVQVGLRFDQ